jgi:hypothetical protein
MGGRRRLKVTRISKRRTCLMRETKNSLHSIMLSMHLRYVMSLSLYFLSNKVWDFKEGSQ